MTPVRLDAGAAYICAITSASFSWLKTSHPS